MILRYSIGLDISMKDFRASMVSIDVLQDIRVIKSRKFDNTKGGFKLFKKWYQLQLNKKAFPLRFTMETTGVYHEQLAFYLHKQGEYVSIVLANRAHKFLQSLDQKSKNDPLDAKGLAQMGAQQNIKQWNPPAVFYQTLRLLTRHYQTLMESKTQEINRLHAITISSSNSVFVVKEMRSLIKTIENKIDKTEKEITKHIDSNSDVRKKVDKLITIKGVAEKTVAVIIAETFGFELFHNARQLVSYSGLDVIENQSGKSQGKTRISKQGNSRIRRALFMPAFSVVKCKVPVFYNLYCRNLPKHHIKMKTYVAIQKKLLTTIYALWKKNQEFDNKYYLSFEENIKVAPNKRELHQVQVQ